MNERGRASGSFLLAVGAVVLAIGGYVAWGFLRPDPYALSERAVRDARRALAWEVREFQRGIEDVAREAMRLAAHKLSVATQFLQRHQGVRHAS